MKSKQISQILLVSRGRDHGLPNYDTFRNWCQNYGEEQLAKNRSLKLQLFYLIFMFFLETESNYNATHLYVAQLPWIKFSFQKRKKIFIHIFVLPFRIF